MKLGVVDQPNLRFLVTMHILITRQEETTRYIHLVIHYYRSEEFICMHFTSHILGPILQLMVAAGGDQDIHTLVLNGM